VWFPGGVSSPPSTSRGLPSRTICYANKYEMPGQYWRELSRHAEHCFVLIGRSNKSWIGRSAEQQEQFALDLVRVVRTGGDVAIASAPAVLAPTMEFFRHRIVGPHLKSDDVLADIMRAKCRYVVTGGIHYQAVRSDSRLVLLPILNASEFREESMVIELTAAEQPYQFNTYIEDIDRLLWRATAVDWFKGSLP